MTKIEVVCRRCGRMAPAEEFKIDHVYKLAVCRICFTERQKQGSKVAEDKKLNEKRSQPVMPNSQKVKSDAENNKSYIHKSKLFDEDEDDEYLKRAVEKKKERIKQQKEDVVRVKKIAFDKVLYPCQSCGYKFKFNIETQRPVVCPYCSKKINFNIVF